MQPQNKEQDRINEKDRHQKHWLRWGPYLSERQWGTVREDYSEGGDAWEYFTYEDAIARTYRWGEDGIAGISDNFCDLCFSVSLWNGKDSIIKERLFGLSNPEGNHGEDVKELYYYLDNTPTHSYMKYLYKYTQQEFPYEELRAKNAELGLDDKEFELLDTDVFEDNAYFDVYVEYAKADENDILIKISVANRNTEAAEIHLIPTLFFRNRWSYDKANSKPVIQHSDNENKFVSAQHERLGEYCFYFEKVDKMLFTENETNQRVIFDKSNEHPYTKDLINNAIVNNNFTTACQRSHGTKFSPFIKTMIPAGETQVFKYRLTANPTDAPFAEYDRIFNDRMHECNVFYQDKAVGVTPEMLDIQKYALSGMLWTKQYYNYDVERWLEGDEQMPNPPEARHEIRNGSWKNLRNEDILLMPDKWEYPWYASWDSAFHVISMAMVDIEFAKHQLQLFFKEWYMKPNGQVPAYEWNFSDVNPPVQAWATLMVYNIEKKQRGKGDVHFLKRMFNKMTLNFTWWVNQLDSAENNVFEGGFLGLDNIGIFDRSKGIPGDATLEQVDGTSWVALYCLSMLKISLEISEIDPAYEDMATKFFSHFIYIAESLNHLDEDNFGIWDDIDGFFYDKLVFPDGTQELVKVRSIVGILSLIAVLHIRKETFEALPRFKKSFDWFKKHRMDKLKFPIIQTVEGDDDILISLVPKDRIDILLTTLFDEDEFLSSYGLRSLSKRYTEPYVIELQKKKYEIQYTPAESDSNMFGGNSNWRGPIWFPINYIIIDSLHELYKFYGDNRKYAFPTGTDNMLNLKQISVSLSKRLISIFQKNDKGNRPANLLHKDAYRDPYFHELILFYEYFDGDNGRGVGAAHQTGWTALVANLIEELNDDY